QEGKSDLSYVGKVDRVELYVTERQIQGPLVNDARRFTQIFLHEAGGAQMRPGQPGGLEVLLDDLVHQAEWKGCLGPSIQAREFNDVSNPCCLAGIDERTLCLDHVRCGRRKHEHALDAPQSRCKAALPRHVSFNQFYRRNFLEMFRFGSIPYEESHGDTMMCKFVRNE